MSRTLHAFLMEWIKLIINPNSKVYVNTPANDDFFFCFFFYFVAILMAFVWMAKNKHKLLIRQIKLVGSTRRAYFSPILKRLYLNTNSVNEPYLHQISTSSSLM